MLGVLLGVLCDAHLLLDPKILKLLVLGIVALLLSGIGGIMGGYIMYFIKKGNYNPVIGIAAVSCVPTTAKVAQKIRTRLSWEMPWERIFPGLSLRPLLRVFILRLSHIFKEVRES